MRVDPKQLKSFLIESGLVPSADVKVAFDAADGDEKKLAESLINNGKISEDDYRRVRAYVLGIPYVDLKKEKVGKEVLSLIPEPIARKYNIVAYRKTETDLEVAMLDPEDLEAINFIKKGVGLKISPRLTDAESIKNVLLQYQKSLKAEFGDIIKKESATVKSIQEESGQDVGETDLKKMAADLPIIKIVDSLLSHAVLQKASDIHIEPYEHEEVIRYRIDGILHDAMILPKDVAPGITARIKVLSNLRLDEKRLPQDGRFKIETPDQKVSFRVSILPTYFGEKIVMRLLPESVRGFTLEGGGFHGSALEQIHGATHKSTGMILVTGPTGSGKSTTLYTILDILNTPDVNISTIEDPIEYQMPRINQSQIKPEIGFTFAAGIRTLVRQDPDIIMVGEIRDKETIQLAINAALTGHLVLSTLHTNSAAATIPRMLDMGAEPFLVVSTVNIIVAQRLVRRLTKTRKEYHLTAAEQKKLAAHIDLDRVLKALKEEKVVDAKADWSKITFYRPEESGESKDGYAGRIGIHEVLPLSPAIRDLIMKGETADAIESQARKEGMLTMAEDGIFLAAQGFTSIEEVLRVTSSD